MKINLNQKLITLIEYYNLLNADLLLSEYPLKRIVHSSHYTFSGTKLDKLNKLKKKYNSYKIVI